MNGMGQKEQVAIVELIPNQLIVFKARTYVHVLKSLNPATLQAGIDYPLHFPDFESESLFRNIITAITVTILPLPIICM